MIFPIHGIAFALCAGPIQTSLSRLTAASPEKGRAFLRVSLALSLSIALPLTSLIYTFADFLAARVLLAPECAPLLPALALSIPFCAIHACCCGYYYGLKNGSPGIFTGGRAVHPHFLRPADRPCPPHEQDSYHGAAGCLGAVDRGSGIGGVLSAGLWMLEACCHTAKCKHTYYSPAPPPPQHGTPPHGKPPHAQLSPESRSHLCTEPASPLRLSRVESVSIYGVLTGIGTPLCPLPSAITNSLAVVLLPAVSEAQAQNQPDKIERTISMALRYSLYMGILCVGLFTRFGPALGETFYHNADAGRFIQILSWLCPFLYLSTTMGSILNGLGKTGTVFIHHTVSMLLTLSLVLFAIPRWGIFAYLAALLISELVLAFLHIHALACEVPIRLPVSQGIVKPAFCLLVSIGMLEV